MKSESSDVDTVSKITAQDFEDAANEELAQFKFAPIETGNSFLSCLEDSLEREWVCHSGESINLIL